MVDYTDRHYRTFIRQITRRTLLYTEMTATGAVRGPNAARVLAFSEAERPLALQVGGDDPRDLAECARIAEQRGYDEVNLNVGCPSDRVQRGRFGACLMAEPELVARCVEEMRAAVDIAVTVKHRVGIDGLDRYEDLRRFVDIVARAGCDRFIVHARIAILAGLSPKDNRSVPPLRYADVHRLKRERPDLTIEINGGFRTLDQAAAQLARVDGVMIGRAAYDDPFILCDADARFFDAEPASSSSSTREAIVEAMIPYVERCIAEGWRPHAVTRHMLGLFHGRPGARRWRRTLSELGARPDATADVLRRALDAVGDHPR